MTSRECARRRLRKGAGWLAIGVVVSVAAAGGGCATGGHGPAIGSSTAPGGVAGGASLDGGGEGGVPANPVPSDFRTSMTRLSAARFLSKGHAGGRWDVDVYADPAGADALRSEKWPVPVGARFVEEHFERNDGGAGPIMMMEKRSAGFDPGRGDWRYVAIGARGEVVKDGVIEGCAGCHGEAPGDHVFRAGGER